MQSFVESEIALRPMPPRLAAALEVMDSPPAAVVAMNEVLRRSPVDLRQLGCVAQAFARPIAQILNLCNSSLFGLERPVSSLEQATVVLGAHVLRGLVLAWGLVDRVGKFVLPSQAQPFWQHSLTVALMSERIAAWRHYAITEAYLAGFTHDIGRAPLLVAGAAGQPGGLAKDEWAHESIEAEERVFGTDHCELGRRIGNDWGFPEPFGEVFSRHHSADLKTDESELVRIVTTAEALCARQPGPEPYLTRVHLDQYRDALSDGLPDLDLEDITSLAEALDLEFLFEADGLALGVPGRVFQQRRGRSN